MEASHCRDLRVKDLMPVWSRKSKLPLVSSSLQLQPIKINTTNNKSWHVLSNCHDQILPSLVYQDPILSYNSPMDWIFSRPFYGRSNRGYEWLRNIPNVILLAEMGLGLASKSILLALKPAFLRAGHRGQPHRDLILNGQISGKPKACQTRRSEAVAGNLSFNQISLVILLHIKI